MSISITNINTNIQKISEYDGIKIQKLNASDGSNIEIKFLLKLKSSLNCILNVKGSYLLNQVVLVSIYNLNNILLNKYEFIFARDDECFDIHLENEQYIIIIFPLDNLPQDSNITLNYLQMFSNNYQIFFFTNFSTSFFKPGFNENIGTKIMKKTNDLHKEPILKIRNDLPTILFIVDYVYMYNNLAETRYKFINYLVEKNSNIITIGTGSKHFTQGIDIFTLVKRLNIRPSIIIHANNFTKNKLLVSNLIKYPCKKALIIEDMHACETINNLIKYNGIHYVLYHCDCSQLDRIKLLNRQCRFINYPHFIDTNIFKNYNQRKDYDFILYGCINENVYPFRSRLFNLIRKHKRFRTLYIPFPGYFVRNKKNITTGTKLAKMINRAYIGISTTSLHDYFLKKYLEIPACFTMVAGNIPSRYRKIFKNKMIELKPNMSDSEIIAILEEELRDKTKLMEKINILHNIVINSYSFENGLETFDKIVKAINDHQPVNYLNRKLNLLGY